MKAKTGLILYVLPSFLLLTAIWVFFPTLQKMESVWRGSETYMHCYFILPITLWLIWRKKHELLQTPSQPALLIALLIIPVLVLWLAAYTIDVSFASHFAVVFFIQLSLWSLLGHKKARIIRFPLLFLLFAVPFGEAINPALQDITAYLTVWLLNLANIPVFREGLYLHTPIGLFEVAVACSGLNFLIASTVISCLFGYFHYSKLSKQILFVLFTLVLSILANGIRAFVLIYVAYISDFRYGFGADHYYYGWLVFALVTMLSFWIGRQFSDDITSADQTLPLGNTTHTLTVSKKWKTPLVLWILLSITGLLSRQIATVEAPSVASPVVSLPEFVQVTDSDWGITFYDGLTRDLLRKNQLEIFIASYANRQHKGDMITWHNRLFDHNSWTITGQKQQGSLFDGFAILQLTNAIGQQRTVLYWYQLGNLRTTNKALFKLAQLADIVTLQHQSAVVKAISVSNYSYNETTDDLENYRAMLYNLQPVNTASP